jgi:hypothetical protein
VALHLRRSDTPLLSVVPDATYPNMWRISLRDRLSDLVNLSRAKDAAVSWALHDLNHAEERASEAPWRGPTPERGDD